MKKTVILLFFAAFLSITALAQSVQEGVNNLYAERYQSAKAIFEKLLATNPNNIEATYWLGQTYIANKDVAGAKSIYDKALASSNNAPLILVGEGEIELLEGKAADAPQHFETAINATHTKKGNNPNILDAVGKAIADTYSESHKVGDLDYAIAKLNEASQLAPTNPDISLNLGNAYLKKRDGTSGSNAVQAYRKAGNYAPALYRTAMVFKTQTTYRQSNWDVILENLNNAIAADPKFAPAYLELYYYYLLAKQDFPTAENYANKYIASSDPSVENDYLKAQTDFVQQKFTEAINLGKNIISQTNSNANPRVYRMLAYSYMGNKDTTTACDYANQFFTKATNEEQIFATDYLMHAQACGKNNPDLLREDIAKAIQKDPDPNHQITIINEAIDDARKAGQRLLVGELGLMRYKLLGAKANPASLLNPIGIDFYYGSQFQTADSLFQLYNKAFPDSIYGYLWSAKALVQIDTAMTQGLAVPSYEQMLRVTETDKTRDLYKTNGAFAASYIAAYYINIKQDKATAKTYVDRGLILDPTNETLLNEQKIVNKQPAKQPTPKQSTQKNHTSSHTAKNTKTKNKGK